MIQRRGATPDLGQAHEALAEGRYDAAFALFESAMRRARRRSTQAQIALQLAAAYALYGEDGLEGGQRCLHDASAADPAVAQTPLYRALYWEFSGYRGDPVKDVRRGALAAAGAQEPVADYHAASALLTVGGNRRAIKILQRIDDTKLPEYLRWRRHSLIGHALERTGEFERAASAYSDAARLTLGRDRHNERLKEADCWIEIGRASEAEAALGSVDEAELNDPLDIATKRLLEGRVHLQRRNPSLALERLLEAKRLEDEHGDPSFDVVIALAQTYAFVGQFERSISLHEEAARVAPPEERAFARHELSFALLEGDRLLEARDELLEVVEDDAYEFRSDAFADLAEVEFRLGNFDRAEDLARRALDLGAVAAACMCLGNLALEYYRLDDAVAWFEQVVSATREGEGDWVGAQELLADIEVQRGFERPDRVLRHAKAALAYLQPGDEWATVLEGYVREARRRLGEHSRLLN